MRRHRIGRVLLLAGMAVILVACGEKETPEQHLDRLRGRFEITPLGYTTVHNPQTGEPSLVIDLRVVNQGTEKLNHLTVLVRVLPADGSAPITRRVTLDLTDVRPGVGVQLSTTVPGLEVAEGDEVQVEIERQLTPEELRSLPEYRDLTKG